MATLDFSCAGMYERGAFICLVLTLFDCRLEDSHDSEVAQRLSTKGVVSISNTCTGSQLEARIRTLVGLPRKSRLRMFDMEDQNTVNPISNLSTLAESHRQAGDIIVCCRNEDQDGQVTISEIEAFGVKIDNNIFHISMPVH